MFLSASRSFSAISASAPASPRLYGPRSMTGNSSLDAPRSMSRVIAAVMSGSLLQGRADVAHGDPAQVAHAAFVEMPSAMHCATIVPDQQIALAPVVAIDELAPRRVLDQLAQQQPSIRQGPANDLRGVRGDIERLAPGPRMRAHDPLRHRRQHVLLAEQQIDEAELRPRPRDVV